MADETSIQVNFGRPMPLFPLDGVTLLPQQVLPLHIFEPRYRQMVEDALDGPGQIAMAVFKGDRWKQEYHGRPPIHNAVCIGQIIQHERLADGRFNIVLQGICRGRIVEESGPQAGKLYRQALLEPVGIDDDEEHKLYGVRERLAEMLSEGPLTRMTAAEWVIERIENEAIPTSVILELVSFTLLTDRELRLKLLNEGDAAERAELVQNELVSLSKMLRRAEAQHPEEWPKGMSWN